MRPPEATPPVGDPSHARTALGWEPEISFEDLIGGMVAADLDALRRYGPLSGAARRGRQSALRDGSEHGLSRARAVTA